MTSELAALEPTTVLLIAAPVAVALFLLVVLLFASQRSRPAVATRLERDAARRDRSRRRRQEREVEEDEDLVPALVGAGHAEAEGDEAHEAGTALAVPVEGGLEVGPPPSIRTALEEAQRARLVAPPVPRRDPEKAELDRRQFINKSILGGTTLGLGFFGIASIAFLYPKPGGGFGGKVSAGVTPEDAIAVLENTGRPFYNGEGRFYVVPFRFVDEAAAKKVYTVTFEAARAAGVMALYQKCAHLGCRVPWCDSSQWFECPCHGSQYNSLGEIQRGPAPRGLSRFQFSIAPNGEMVVDTSKPMDAPPKGPNTPGIPESPNHCVAG